MRDTTPEKLEQQLKLRAADYQLTDVSFRSFQVPLLLQPAKPLQGTAVLLCTAWHRKGAWPHNLSMVKHMQCRVQAIPPC